MNDSTKTEQLQKEVDALHDQLGRLNGTHARTVAGLSEDRGRLAHALETIADGVVICDQQRRYIFANASAERILGFPRSEILRRSYDDPAWRITKIDGHSIAEHEAVITQTLRTGAVVYGAERVLTLPDGTQRVISLNTAPLRDAAGNIVAAVVSFTDVTERKRAEEALRRSHDGLEARVRERTDELEKANRRLLEEISEHRRTEEALRESGARFRLLFERNQAGAVIATLAGKVLDCNPAFCRILGFDSCEEVLAHPAAHWYADPADRDVLLQRLKEQGSLTNYEICFRDRHGNPVRVLENITLVADRQEGQVIHGTVIDLTERLRAQEAQQRSEARYRLLFERSLAGVLITKPDGEILDCNPSCVRILGCASLEEVRGRRSWDFYADPAQRHAMLDRLRTTGALSDYEVLVRQPSGRLVWVLENITLRKDDDGAEFILGTLVDISGRKQAEDELRQVTKLEAVGRLAGGVAHDFNNLLTVILGYSDLLLTEVTTAEMREPLTEVRKAGERAARLTQQLLAFSRKQVLHTRAVDLNAMVTGMRDMLRPLIGEDIELEFELAPDLGLVHADPHQLEHALLNLAANARDAMPHGGTIAIETHNAVIGADYAGVRPGAYVALIVRDSGCGMDQATQAHLFEPFFTTKEFGRGTGLGLASVFGIIKQSEGHIEVDSEPGEGSTFRMYLPRLMRPTPVAPDEEPVAAVTPRGKETILLVEDEEGVRNLSSLVLRSCGYTVLAAEDAEQAMDLAGQDLNAFDLLVTDVVMPGGSGKQLADQLRLFRPGVKVLFMSGYTHDVLDTHGVQVAGAHFIQKPFTTDELARKVYEVLNE